MVHNVPYQSVSDAQRLYEYAIAYLTGAIDSAAEMVRTPERATWPSAAVITMLASHASELFLKAILWRAHRPYNNTHDLQRLQNDVRSAGIFIGFRMPVTYEGFELPDDFRRALKNEKALNDPSIVYRYPFAEPGKEWRVLHSVEPVLYAAELEQVRDAMMQFWET